MTQQDLPLVSRYDDAPARGEKPPRDFGVDGAKELRFSGDAYDPALDAARLTGQIERIYLLMKDGRWRTLSEIATATGDPEASISAQLRHLKKDRFGAHAVEKRARGDRGRGLFEYQLTPNLARTRRGTGTP